MTKQEFIDLSDHFIEDIETDSNKDQNKNQRESMIFFKDAAEVACSEMIVFEYEILYRALLWCIL